MRYFVIVAAFSLISLNAFARGYAGPFEYVGQTDSGKVCNLSLSNIMAERDPGVRPGYPEDHTNIYVKLNATVSIDGEDLAFNVPMSSSSDIWNAYDSYIDYGTADGNLTMRMHVNPKNPSDASELFLKIHKVKHIFLRSVTIDEECGGFSTR